MTNIEHDLWLIDVIHDFVKFFLCLGVFVVVVVFKFHMTVNSFEGNAVGKGFVLLKTIH